MSRDGSAGSGRRSRRLLTDEEHQLWQKVRRTVEPLQPHPGARQEKQTIPSPSVSVAEPIPQAVPAPRRVSMPSYHPPVSARGGVAGSGTIDERTRRDLARGKRRIEATLDLHGMTQEMAWSALSAFLAGASREGKGLVLVITGKGRMSEGVLRRAVPGWLRHPLLQQHVSAFREANDAHGGSGALYVRIRKPEPAR